MLIGVDLDNTIVRYDELFVTLAAERGLLPGGIAPTKNAVRDHLRSIGLEGTWTEMQGETYGRRMRDAQPFPGAMEFFAALSGRKIPSVVVSHRTRYPYAGERHDLHHSARAWLAGRGMTADSVYLEESKAAKVRRITDLGCTVFIDDLPEIFAEPGFPEQVTRILFDPNDRLPDVPGVIRLTTWEAIRREVLDASPIDS